MYPEEASSFSVLSIGHEHLQEHEAPLPPPSVATRRRGTAAGAAAAWGAPARLHTAARSQSDGLMGRRQDEASGAEAESATTEPQRPHGMLDVGFDCAVGSRISHV